MSCRVLGRTAETCFLSWIATESLNGGASKLTALYRSTPKNKPFAEFYKSWGMSLIAEDSTQGTQRWSYDLASGASELQLPAWIKIEVISNERD